MSENKFGLVIYNWDWRISKAVRLNVWLALKFISSTEKDK